MLLIEDKGPFKRYIVFHDKLWTVTLSLNFQKKKGRVNIAKHGAMDFYPRYTSQGEILYNQKPPQRIRDATQEAFMKMIKHGITPS